MQPCSPMPAASRAESPQAGTWGRMGPWVHRRQGSSCLEKAPSSRQPQVLAGSRGQSKQAPVNTPGLHRLAPGWDFSKLDATISI